LTDSSLHPVTTWGDAGAAATGVSLLNKCKVQAPAPGIHVCNRDIDSQIMRIKKCGHLIFILALDTEIKYHQKWARGGEDIKKEGREIKEEKEKKKYYLVANATLFYFFVSQIGIDNILHFFSGGGGMIA
jgi:hypothetical protein